MNDFENEYKDLLLECLMKGEVKENRTEVNTLSLFNRSLTIDLNQGFPIVTSKEIFFDKALAEYNWMIQGLTHLTYLHQHGIKWWDEYADNNGYLGKTYGYQMRSWNGEIDQLDVINKEIRMNTRRAHMTLWNPSDMNQVVLPPCFTGMTFMRVGGKLNMSVQFRSSDMFLGLPYDVAVFALMLQDIAEFNDLKPNLLGIQITDAHIYSNHLKQVRQYLNRITHELPTLIVDSETKSKSLKNYKFENYIYAKLNN